MIPGRGARLLDAPTWRRALAEIAFIVIGVLIAVAASAAWDQRRERKIEEEALREMRVALTVDIADMRSDLERYKRVAESAQMLLAHLKAGRPYEPGLDTLFGHQLIYRKHLSNSASYESLKSQGLGLISDDTLRLVVIDFYSLENATISMWNDFDTGLVEDAFRPYFRTHFWIEPRVPSVARAAKPANYDVVAKDSHLRGLLAHRIDSMNLTIPAYELAIGKAERLIKLIDARLGRE